MFTRTTTALAALLLATLAPAAHADLAPTLDGKCPSNYTLGSNSHGKPRCYSPRDLAQQAEKSGGAKGGAAGTGSSSGRASSGGSGGVAWTPPVKASLPKPGALQRCPSGYYSNNAGDQCVSHWDQAPAVTAKKGACPAGTVEEWGAWCTAALKDTSDPTLDQIEGYRVRDFNAVYLAHQLAGKPTPTFSEESELFRQAKAARQAAGDPWRDRIERDRLAQQAKAAADKPAEGGEASVAASAEAVKDAAAEAAKDLGKSLRGLFGR